MGNKEKIIVHGVYFLIIIILIAGFIIEHSKLNAAIQLTNECVEIAKKFQDLLEEERQSSLPIKDCCVPESTRVTVTCYQSYPDQTDSTPEITAFNTKVGPGMIAVSRDLLELGFTPHRKVYLEGYGVFKVADVMNKRYKRRVDIWVPKDGGVFKDENVLLAAFSE